MRIVEMRHRAQRTVRRTGDMSLPMTYGIAVLAAMIGAAAGWFGGHLLNAYARDWIALPNVELAGQTWRSGGIRELCALIGLVAGILTVLRFHGGFRQKRALVPRTLLVTFLSVGVIYAAFAGGDILVNTLGVNPLIPEMEFQIRLPPGAALPESGNDVQVELRTDRNETLVAITAATSGDRPVVSGYTPLIFRTAQRTIVLSLRGQPTRIFRLRLPSNPPASPQYGPWQQVDFVVEPGRAPQRADITADYAIRYHIR
jgi:hypothetical protein